jgi:hypothetical protein
MIHDPRLLEQAKLAREIRETVRDAITGVGFGLAVAALLLIDQAWPHLVAAIAAIGGAP